MRFISCSYGDFLRATNGKKIIQFGASSAWNYYMNIFPNIEKEVVEKTEYIVDNSQAKQGTIFSIGNCNIKIVSPDILRTIDDYAILITVSTAFQEDICKQLVEMNLSEDIECFSLQLMTLSFKEADNSAVDNYFISRKEKKIPARIHSFWFSGEEKPELYKRCVDSWYKHCPDFEIIEWNTKNYDISKNQYMLEAYEHRKWAFVSDYARLDVVYNYGGIYLDMDVELVVSLSPILYADSFFCRQEDGIVEFGSGFGAPKGDPLVKELLDSYKNEKLVMDNGEINKIPQPERLNPILLKKGIMNSHDSQVIGDALFLSNDYITCYSSEESILNPRIGIHWHNGGWLDDDEKEKFRATIETRKILMEKYFVLS